MGVSALRHGNVTTMNTALKQGVTNMKCSHAPLLPARNKLDSN